MWRNTSTDFPQQILGAKFQSCHSKYRHQPLRMEDHPRTDGYVVTKHADRFRPLRTWRIIPLSKCLVVPICTAMKRRFGTGPTTPLRGTYNHHGYSPLTSPGMIFQVRIRVVKNTLSTNESLAELHSANFTWADDPNGLVYLPIIYHKKQTKSG